MKINPTDKIGDVLKKHTEAYEVFLANGFKASSVDKLIDSLGKDTMLQTVLKVKGINVDIFINMINEKSEHNSIIETTVYELYDPRLPLNVLVQTPCPTRLLLKERLTELLKSHKEETGEKINCYVVDGCGSSFKHEDVWMEEDIDKLPDIIMSKGFDVFYNKEFIDKFIRTGKFENVLEITNQEFSSINCLDDSYTLNTAMVDVMLVDKKRLGDIPKPKSWKDLLDPIYKDQIIASGRENIIAKGMMLYLYKEFGQEAIEQFAHNVKDIYHNAKMVKIAGTNSSEGGSIYITSLTFAKTCEKNDVSIIWPEDGANISPLSILVKKDKVKKLDVVIDCLLNDYGKMCTSINAISLNPKIKNNTPDNANYKWLGWDYIKDNDIVKFGEELQERFHKIWDNK